MTWQSQRNMKALAKDFSIRHPGEGRGPFRVSLDWIPASAGMTKQRIPTRDFQAKTPRHLALDHRIVQAP